MKQFLLTYLILVLFGTFCFAQSVKSKAKSKPVHKSTTAFNISKYSFNKPDYFTGSASGVEFGISKRINSETKKNRLSVGTDFATTFQNSMASNISIKPNISYNINLWKNFYFKPRVSLGATVYRNNYYIDCPVGVSEGTIRNQGKTFGKFNPTIGFEPNYTFLKTTNYNFNFFTRFELQQTSMVKLMPVTVWQIGLNVTPTENSVK